MSPSEKEDRLKCSQMTSAEIYETIGSPFWLRMKGYWGKAAEEERVNDREWVLFTIRNGALVEVARGSRAWCVLRRAVLRIMRPYAAIALTSVETLP